MIQVEDARFPELLRRAATLTPQQVEALGMLATYGAVDVRRIARALGVCRAECTNILRGLLMAGLASYDAGRWRFAYRGARRV